MWDEDEREDFFPVLKYLSISMESSRGSALSVLGFWFGRLTRSRFATQPDSLFRLVCF